jgi:hypothetical protein
MTEIDIATAAAGPEVDGATDTGLAADGATATVTTVETEASPDTCPRCSAERLDGVPFCTNCTLRFLPADFWVVRQAAAPAVESIAVRRRRRWPWVLLLLLLLVAGAAAVYYVLYGVPPELAEYQP